MRETSHTITKSGHHCHTKTALVYELYDRVQSHPTIIHIMRETSHTITKSGHHCHTKTALVYELYDRVQSILPLHILWERLVVLFMIITKSGNLIV